MTRAVNSVTALVALVALTGLGLGAASPQVKKDDATAFRQTASVQQHPGAAASFSLRGSVLRELLSKYCVVCHNDRSKTAGLSLETINLARITPDSAPVLEKVVVKLRAGLMPPAGMPRPDKATYNGLAASLEAALDEAAAAKPNPGQRPRIHRLNRAEYVNAVRDLLALDIDGESLLPADDAAYGFDNIADLLSVSPSLLDRYLFAARKIAGLAVGDPSIRSAVHTYDISSELKQDDRMSEALPFGTRGGRAVSHYFPVDGEYVVSVRLSSRDPEVWKQVDLRMDGERLTPATGGDPAPAAGANALRIRAAVKAGRRLVGAALLKRTSATEGLRPARVPLSDTDPNPETTLAIEGIDIEGPYSVSGPGDTPSRRRIFICRPVGGADEERCVQRILTTLARRAYRRPATREDVQSLASFYKPARAGKGFEAGIQRALERLLVDPDFLFRVEYDPANVALDTPYPISDVELASRLAFFLWSSIPDDELLDVAARGKLKEATVLERQVRRMLADPRSLALVNNFAAQWLHLRNVRAAKPDRYAFPEFDDNLREAFQRETELFLEDQLRADRSVAELLTANYTFVNERLASHLGIPGIYGSHFRRVILSDDARAGLLGHASILMVTSKANRTSPVVRGKWILDNILGAPPPPPPPNVPELEETDTPGKVLSMRERMALHRKNPVCASCHAVMDPIGLALENFDGIGRWRTTEAGAPIDSSGVLLDGTKIQGAASLRQVLASRRDEFVAAFTKRLLTYALGRGLEYYDAPVVRQIVREAAPGDYRWSSIILGIVRSTPFRMNVRSK